MGQVEQSSLSCLAKQSAGREGSVWEESGNSAESESVWVERMRKRCRREVIGVGGESVKKVQV